MEETNNKPAIKVRGARQNLAKKERNEKPKYSNFHLTINTNQQYKENDPHLTDDTTVFDDSIRSILDHIDEYVKVPEGNHWTDEKIKDVDIDYVIEHGAKKGQLHCHILLKFKHHSKVQLDYAKIKEKLIRDLGVSNVYMYNRLIRNSGNQNVLDYLHKYV